MKQILALLTSVCLVSSAPANDFCPQAIPLTSTAVVLMDGGTDSGSPPDDCCTALRSDVWFTYTAPCNGVVFFQATGPPTDEREVDISICVFAGNCTLLQEVQCRDFDHNAPGYIDSRDIESVVLLDVQQGQRYKISIGSVNLNALGNVTIEAECHPNVPNDECDGALPLAEGYNFVQNNWGAISVSKIPTSCPFVVEYGADTWFSWQAPCTGTATAMAYSIDDYDIALVHWPQGCANTTNICTDDVYGPGFIESYSWSVVQGEYHYFSIGTVAYDCSRICTPRYTTEDCSSRESNFYCFYGDLNVTIACNGVRIPTDEPTLAPTTRLPTTLKPTRAPSVSPTKQPTGPTPVPTVKPTADALLAGSRAATGLLIGSGSVIGLFAIAAVFVVCWRRRRPPPKDLIPLETLPEKKPDREPTETKTPLPELSTVNFNEITVHDQLGEGAFGTVHRCVWAGADYAVKRLTKSTPEADAEFDKEVHINQFMLSYPHTCVVRAICISKDPRAIVMELYPLRSVEQYIIRKRNYCAPNDFGNVLTILVNASAGILHLHSVGVIHRDIAARNFLIKGDLSTAVCDFGLSLILPDPNAIGLRTKAERTLDQLPVNTSAPETLFKGEYSCASDVYMFGMFIWEMLARKHPWTGSPDLVGPMPNFVRFAINVQGGARPYIPDTWPTPLAELITRCTRAQPAERPSMKVVNAELRVYREQVVKYNIPLPAVEEVKEEKDTEDYYAQGGAYDTTAATAHADAGASYVPDTSPKAAYPPSSVYGAASNV